MRMRSDPGDTVERISGRDSNQKMADQNCVWKSPDFIRDIYISLSRDNEEPPTREGLDVFTRVFKLCKPSYLSLRSSRIGPAATIALVKRLEDSNISVIDLYDNFIKDTGFMAILKFSERHPTFKRLCVGCNDIGSEGALALAEVLQGSCGLKAVELGRNVGRSFQALQTNLLAARTMHSNCIDSVAGAKIAKALMYNGTLEYLGLSDNYIGLANVDPSMRGSGASARVLGGVSIETDGSTSFGSMLAVNTTLRSLDLSGNRLGNAGATAIIRGLGRNTTLTHIDLSNNMITYVAVPLLSNILLSEQCAIVDLALSFNPLGFEGAKSLSYGLSCCKTICSLALEDCAIGNDGVAILCTVLANPLLGAWESTEKFDQFLDSTLHSHGESDFQNKVCDQDERYEAMMSFFDRLTSKSSRGSEMVIVRKPSGRIVSAVPIQRRRYNSRPVSRIISPQRPESMGVKDFDSSAERNLQQDDDCINIDNDPVPQTDTPLNIEPSPQPGGDVMQASFRAKPDERVISTAPDTTDPTDMSTSLGIAQAQDPACMQQVGDVFSQIESVPPNLDSIVHTYDDNIASFINRNNQRFSQITSLNLAANGIDDAGVDHISNLLATRPYLSYLNLSHNKLGSGGALKLASALLCCQVDIDEVLEYYSKDGAYRMACKRPSPSKPHCVNASLHTIDLTTCSISDEGFIALAFAFIHIPNLRVVKLSDNFISSVGGAVGIEILEESKTLLVCSMRGNQISHTSVKKLATLITANHKAIAMRLPLELRVRLDALMQETSQLPIVQEELDFITKFQNEMDHHKRVLKEQGVEMIEAFERTESHIHAKIRQTRDAIRVASESKKEAEEGIPGLKVDLENQYKAAQAAYDEDVLHEKEAERTTADLLRQQEEQDAQGKADLDELRQAKQGYEDKIREIDGIKKRADKLIEALKGLYGDYVKKAQTSKTCVRNTQYMELGSLVPVLERLALVAKGETAIPAPKEYSYLEGILTPRASSSASNLKKKGKKQTAKKRLK